MTQPQGVLWGPLLQAPFFDATKRGLAAADGSTCLTGLVAGSRALVLSLLGVQARRRLIVVVPDDTAVEAYRRDLAAFATSTGQDPRRIGSLPALDADPYDDIAPHPEVVRDRVVALDRVSRGQIDLLLVPARSLLHWLPSPDEWSSWTRTVRANDTLPPDRFVLQALGLGYRRVDTVAAPGEVSRRGGIIDIFPPASHEPVRIELFADTVESLRSFDTDHQRSTGRLDEVAVGPATESPPLDEALKRVADYLHAGTREAGDDDDALRRFRARLDQLTEHGYWPGFESLARLTSARPALLFDWVKEMDLVVDEPERTVEELARAAHELQMSYEQSENRTLPPPGELFADPLRVEGELGRARLVLRELAGAQPEGQGPEHSVVSRPARAYAGRIQDWVEDLRRGAGRTARTVCILRARGSADRLREILDEYDVAAADLDEALRVGLGPTTAVPLVGVGSLRAGFEFPDLGLVVLSERDLFGEERKAPDRRGGSRAAFISDFRDLKPGDHVVHVDHGVARFGGLGRPKGGSLNRDFMVLEFSAGDKLFVPADRLDLVQRYSGVAGQRAVLDRLGGPGWERVKAKVRKSVQLMARELLQLYARRATAKGHAFSPDTAWQRELEAAFPYELTPDQQRVVGEVKQEMESERAMDRLIVGDVGFGKTEVAVRAAFKAVMDGRQVALLTPTTVLALQHFETISERFAAFPVRVEMVSRFRSPSQVRRTLEDVRLGAVDLLIGTHRMLSKDVEFKSLGLLLVDEEQRFGVAAKERLRKLALGVDVLSMTATPIPRTLQMSMAGVRDLSVIETPPPGRMAIQTYIVPFRKNVLAQAIRQELRRQGQIFVVHDRVQTLPALVRTIEEMVPEARVLMGHGQLPERKLESVMMRFVEHEADVLVTTTIIENGLDIPRANTIIVNRADRFGLAQLYQLRGRVGRSHHHAYAYFVVEDRQSLSNEARQRLKALQEFSELGAGFRLAAADLEIRGAGELLGPRQHGHIASLGFDLYCQMLERAVQELKGEPVVERRPPTVHLGVDIKIPESYLPDSGDRLALYKRLAGARRVEDLERLQAETEDRFGHLPVAARNLFDMARLRVRGEDLGVKSVDLAEGRLQIRFHDAPAVEPQRVLEIVASRNGNLTPSGMVVLPAPERGADRIRTLADVFERMAGRPAA